MFDRKYFCFQVQKLQNIIASRATQYNHDMKRKEREYNKLKERLHQLVMNKKDKRLGMALAGGGRSSCRGVSASVAVERLHTL